MFYELERFLTDITIPENVTALDRAYNLLSDNGISAHEQELNELIALADNFESGDLLLQIFNILKERLIDNCQLMGVFINNEISLDLASTTFEGLINLTTSFDVQTILTIISSGLNNEETLATILQIMTGIPTHQFLEYIDEVKDALIERIEVLLSDINEELELTMDDTEEVRNTFKEYHSKLNFDISSNMLRDGYSFKTPLELLLNNANEELSDLSSKPNELVKELFGILLMSDLAGDKENVVSKLLESIEDYAADINIVTKAHGFAKAIIQ